jgi:hypothetical protein
LFAHDLSTTASERIQNIIEGNYYPTDLQKKVSECNLLRINEKERRHTLLVKFLNLIDSGEAIPTGYVNDRSELSSKYDIIISKIFLEYQS